MTSLSEPVRATGRADLQFGPLREAFRTGSLTPARLLRQLDDEHRAGPDTHTWIHRLPLATQLAALHRAEARQQAGESLPLFGIPFAVKGNLDVAGLPTTAACPGFGTPAARSARVVRALEDAGAVLVGTTNLDQFATGLSGARSPQGTPVNPLDAELLPGGSSSGSGVAVASGAVGFAIGTDTAGSGRVPAAFTNTVGLKPSRGLVSTDGVLPACRSLDCPSIHAGSVPDALAVLAVIAGPDPEDPWSRVLPVPGPRPVPPDLDRLRVGVLLDLDFEGDRAAAAAFDGVLATLARLGVRPVGVPAGPFLAAGRLLYDGPWVAERLTAVGDFVEAHPEAVFEVTLRVLRTGRGLDARAAFAGMHRLQELSAQVARGWADVDLLVAPTVPTTFTVAEMLADPIGRNTVLGRYTTFANLLDLAVLAVPGGFTATGRPHGVSLIGPAGSDGLLAGLGALLHAEAGCPVGATGHPLSG